MCTIYTCQDGPAATETHGPGAICGHDGRQAGLPGGQGPKTGHLSWAPFTSPPSPTSPLLPIPCDRFLDSCLLPLLLKILKS